MQLLKSLTVDAVPSVTDLFKFAIRSGLQIIKSMLLLYPLNVFIMAIICFCIFYKIIKKVLPKPKYRMTYSPLKHSDNYSEQLKLLKKQMRDVQSELIQMLKSVRQSKETNQADANHKESRLQPERQERNQGENKGESIVANFWREQEQRQRNLSMVQEQLMSAVSSAYQEIAKVKGL